MLNNLSREAVESTRIGEHFIRPRLQDYSFARIPSSILRAFGIKNDRIRGLPLDVFPGGVEGSFERVVVFLVDGLGWNLIEPLLGRKSAALSRFEEEGVVSVITSQYPSTTIVHLVTMNTGLSVGAAGITEWFYYEPRLKRVIAPLLFSTPNSRRRDSLLQDRVKPENVFPTQSIYQELAKHDVASFVYSNASYTPSSFSSTVSRGATLVPTHSPADAYAQLEARLALPGPNYHLVYLDGVDHVSHRYGPKSVSVINEANSFLHQLEQLFFKRVPSNGKTLVLVTADHGQVHQDPGKIIHLNRLIPNIETYLRKDPHGNPYEPCGGPGRHVFLYSKESHREELRTVLRQKLEGRCTVFAFEELLELGLFEREALVADFRERIGDTVVMAHAGESVWWASAKAQKMDLFGGHGGLTPDEMLIPLLSIVV